MSKKRPETSAHDAALEARVARDSFDYADQELSAGPQADTFDYADAPQAVAPVEAKRTTSQNTVSSTTASETTAPVGGADDVVVVTTVVTETTALSSEEGTVVVASEQVTVIVTESPEEVIGDEDVADEDVLVVYEDEDGNLVDEDGNPIEDSDEYEYEVVEEDEDDVLVVYEDEDGNLVDEDGNPIEDSDEYEYEVVEEDEPALPIAAPGSSAQTTDPGWTASFEGTRGYFLIFAFAFLIFSVFAGDRFFRQSDNPHYVLLADSLLRGSWKLDGQPQHPVTQRIMQNDWAEFYKVTMKNGKVYRGRFHGQRGSRRVLRQLNKKEALLLSRDIKSIEKQYYVSFPPMPSFLMMPVMWTLNQMGMDALRYNDMLFTLLFAALAVMLMFWLLQTLSMSGRSGRSLYENLLLTILFALGSVFFVVAVQGQVWFTAIVVGCCFGIAYAGCALQARYPFLAGLFLGAAFLSRPLLLFAGLFFLVELCREDGQWVSPFEGERFQKMLMFALPLAVAIGGIMYANYIRFENPFEFGHTYLPAVYARAERFGLFGANWFVRNFYAFFLAVPKFYSKAPYVKVNAHGLSLFITTPVFLLLFFAKRRTVFFWSLLAVSLVVMLPSLFYQNSGWETFGNRFSVDYTPFLIMALAVSGVTIRSLGFKLLIFAGIVVNTFGAITFYRYWQHYIRGYGSLDWIYKLFSS